MYIVKWTVSLAKLLKHLAWNCVKWDCNPRMKYNKYEPAGMCWKGLLYPPLNWLLRLVLPVLLLGPVLECWLVLLSLWPHMDWELLWVDWYPHDIPSHCLNLKHQSVSINCLEEVRWSVSLFTCIFWLTSIIMYLAWISVNEGLLFGNSCQHSTMKAYILLGQSSGHGSNWRDRIISITSWLLYP